MLDRSDRSQIAETLGHTFVRDSDGCRCSCGLQLPNRRSVARRLHGYHVLDIAIRIGESL